MHETDDSRAEIQRKLTRMVRFIELEGDERTQEIIDRTEEEFHIEKGNLIQEGRIKINHEYDKKFILLKSQTQTEYGIIKQKFHNEILIAKRLAIDNLIEEIQIKIKEDLSCVNRRWSVLQILIMEGLLKLMEKKVIIKCREADATLISKHLTDLEEKYEYHTKNKINLFIDSNYLLNNILPGVKLSIRNQKITLNNTLDERITQIIEFATPVLSTIFYGSKKFRTKR